MKIKRGFVTNSSSTSFLLTCLSHAEGKDEFICKFNSFLDDYIRKNKWRDNFQEPPKLSIDMVEQTDAGTFIIKDFIPIFRGEASIPQYIKELFIEKTGDAYDLLIAKGINPNHMEIKDFNK